MLDRPAKDFEKALMVKGLITIAAADKVIRMLPPLNITQADAREAVRIIAETAAEYGAKLWRVDLGYIASR